MSAKVISISEAPLAPGKRAAIVDEYGALDAQLRTFKPLTDRHAQLKKQIAGWVENHAADQSFTIEGDRYSVQISARAHQRVITSMLKIKNLLGLKKFLEHCKFGLSELDRLVPAEMQSAFVDQSLAGPRTVKAAPKSPELQKAS